MNMLTAMPSLHPDHLVPDDLFLLGLAICIHDLGMVTALRTSELAQLFEGKPIYPDPVYVENFIRDRHHERIDSYIEQELSFLLGLGLSIPQLELVKQIGRAHRKVKLTHLSGVPQYLGAILRMLDELDVTPERAPATVLRNIWTDLDATSCWRWFKHNITAGWTEDYTIKLATVNNRRSISFDLLVHPPRSDSLSYWLHQIHRPLLKALDSEEAGKIIKDRFGVELHITSDFVRSAAVSLPPEWTAMEEKALSANRKTILLIDDEARKMEDLFVPCMDSFHVLFASSAKDGLEKMRAAHIDLAIVDMQVPSGGIWHARETGDFKRTGLKLCEEIRTRFPDTKIAILTGTRQSVYPTRHSSCVHRAET